MTGHIVVLLISVTVCIASVQSECTNDATQLTTTCNLKDSIEVTSSTNPASIAKRERCDVVYDKADFATQPTVVYRAARKHESYTLVMVDPDAPNYLHWTLSNIKGCKFEVGILRDATTLAVYQGPRPPQGTGDHRYMFYVYRQRSARLNLSVPDRFQFNLTKWAQQGNPARAQLCGPIAGVQFKAHF